MCTSTASKPARSNATAISIWPLTPCSRRIATFGRAPVAMNGARDVFGGVEGQLRAAGPARRSGARHRARCRRIPGCRAAAAWRGHRPPRVEQFFPAPFGQASSSLLTRITGAVLGRAMRCARIRSSRARRPGRRTRRGLRRHLHDRAQFFVEQGPQDIAGHPPGVGRMSRPTCEANAISHSAATSAAVGTVVVGQQTGRPRARRGSVRTARGGAPDRRGRARRPPNAGKPAPSLAWARIAAQAAMRFAGAEADQPQLDSTLAATAAAGLAAHVDHRRERGHDQRHRRHRLVRRRPSATAPASTASPCRPGC